MRNSTFRLGLSVSIPLLISSFGCSPEDASLGPGGSGGGSSELGSGGDLGNGSAPATGGTEGLLGSSGGASSAGGGTGSGGTIGGTGGADTTSGDGDGDAMSSGGNGSGGADPLTEPAVLTPGTCKQDYGGAQNGSVTFYTFSQGTAKVNCEYDEVSRNPDKLVQVKTGDGGYFGAINTEDYNTSAACGSCIEITRDGGKKVTITVADRCPIETNSKCKRGHIDLSRAAFLELGNESEGYLGTGNGGMYGQISWKYVPCADDGTLVKLALKKPDDVYWNQVLVTGHRYPVVKVEVMKDGNWIQTVRQMNNYWEPPEGDMGDTGGGGPYRVRVTDTNGSVLEAPMQLKGGAQESGKQFSCN